MSVKVMFGDTDKNQSLLDDLVITSKGTLFKK